jgi:hypothetical protein
MTEKETLPLSVFVASDHTDILRLNTSPCGKEKIPLNKEYLSKIKRIKFLLSEMERLESLLSSEFVTKAPKQIVGNEFLKLEKYIDEYLIFDKMERVFLCDE